MSDRTNAPTRSGSDILAEGLWRISCGDSCPDEWVDLPESHKEWWRWCADEISHAWIDKFRLCAA